MAVNIQPETIQGKATSEVDDFNVEYTFQYPPAGEVTLIRARATKKDNSTGAIDLALVPQNGNLSITYHYSKQDSNLNVINEIVKEFYEIMDSLKANAVEIA